MSRVSVVDPSPGKKSRHGVNTFFRPSNKPVLPAPGQGTFARSSLANNYSAVTEEQVLDLYGTVAGSVVEPFVNTNGIPVSISPTGSWCTLGTLVPVSQGTGIGQRQGRMINVTRINVQGHVFQANMALADGDFMADMKVRIFLVLDRQANGEVPPTQYFLNNIENDSYLSFSNPNYARRRIVVLDSTDVDLRSVGEYADHLPLRSVGYFQFDVNCRIPIEYNNVHGSLNEIRSNNILLFAVLRGSGDSVCQINCISRVCFVG